MAIYNLTVDKADSYILKTSEQMMLLHNTGAVRRAQGQGSRRPSSQSGEDHCFVAPHAIVTHAKYFTVMLKR